MSLSTYIARRYFFAKTSRNAVNVISGISILGILVGTLSLVIVLSAFNGLEQLVGSFYSTFNPDIKITPKEGKYFVASGEELSLLQQTEGVQHISKVLEERVLIGFQDKEHIGSLKGVDPVYSDVTGLSNSIRDGEYDLYFRDSLPSLVLGAGVAYYLGYSRLSLTEPVQIFIPKTGVSAANFNQAFSAEVAYPTGIFTIQPEFDLKYAITNLPFVQQLLNRPDNISALELSITKTASLEKVKQALVKKLGDKYDIKDRWEQQAVFMKVMKSESLFTFLVFALILTIASFTIMGSLSMMMLDKREHLRTLHALGTDIGTLRMIFFKEGLMISGVGAFLGLLLGLVAVLIQQEFGLIKLGQGYVVESYPVVLKLYDIVLILCTVAVLGGLSSWLTSRRLNESLLHQSLA